MAGSWFTAQKDSVLAAGSANFATRIATGYAALNLSQTDATHFGTLNTAFQTALAACNAPGSKSKSLVAAKNSARENMRIQAAALGRQISPMLTVSNQVKIDLGLAVGTVPAPRPAPGTAEGFTSSVSINGVVTTKWKSRNYGIGGTMYQVYRSINDSQDFVFLGGVGEKKFVDATIPAAATSVTYQVQAVRSTVAGEFAEFRIQLGGAVTGATQAKARDASAAAVKLAA